MGSLRIMLLLLLFTLAVLFAQYSTPVMEGMDEPVHYNYIEFLRAENRLPDRTTYLTNSTRQASGQPPLVYWLAGLPLRLLNPTFENGQTLLDELYHTVRNHWVVPNMDTSNRRDNLNLYYHGRDEQAFENPLVVYKVHIMRLMSLLLALIAVAGAYAASQEVFPHSAWAIVSTALFAFTPTMIEAGSTVTNDIGAICFGTLAIWQTLRLIKRGDRPFSVFMMGIFVALAGLSKINGLLIVPGMLVALLLANRSRGQTLKRLIFNSALFAIPILILFAPWVIWGSLQYHDPIGINTHQHGDPRYYFATLRPLSEVVKLLPDFYVTYWGNVSPRGTNIFSYTLISIIPITACIGYLVSISVKQSFMALMNQQIITLVIIGLAMFGAIIYWMRRQSDVWARLIYPAQAAFALLITIGLYQLARRFPLIQRPLQYGSTAFILMVGMVLNPLTLQLTFGLPQFIPADTQLNLQGTVVDFDHTIRFLGYDQPSNRLADDKHDITLCWEVLKTTTKPAVFSLKFVHDGQILADRTSIHGLGHFNSLSWQVGDRFCDRFDIFIDDPDVPDDPPPIAGQAYDMLVTILNAKTLEADWQATTVDNQPVKFPFVGQVVSPAGDMSAGSGFAWESSDVAFTKFAHIGGYTLNKMPTAGEMIQLSLLWEVDQNTPDSWTEFIHLTGPNGSQSVGDSIPRNGNYPTWAWSAGEKIIEQWSLQMPSDLAPGDYTLEIGFYQPTTNQRMPATQASQDAPNNSPVLVHFHVF